MIAVIADDFTGAAEIGGVGLKYGLKVVIETQVKRVEETDLMIIAADTRTLNEADAYKEIEKITKKLLKQNPKYIFKKLDSVLRGNIAVEIKAQLDVTGKKRAIMVAGNPSFGRIIEHGNYSINGIPLAETSFANDPDFPVQSSVVTDIIKSDDIEIGSFSANDEIPEEGIIVGDVKSQEDMDEWARKIDEGTVVAGGAGFFDVLMSKIYNVVQPSFEGNLELGEYALFIFGSKYPKSDKLPMGLDEKDTVRMNMPDEIYENPDLSFQMLNDWAMKIVENLKKRKNVIVTVAQDYSKDPDIAEHIRKNIGEVVKQVAQKIRLSDLLIEGGATTSEILKAIGISKLFPNKLVLQGIIQMTAQECPGLILTTKPGSYPWPENIMLSNKHERITNKL